MKFRIKDLFHELKHHFPFTFIATFLAILFSFLIKNFYSFSPEMFDYFHFIHIFFSSITSSAIFFKYKKNLFFALFVGVSSSLIFGTLSDIFFPFLSAFLFGFNPVFHLPLLENSFLVFFSSFLGALFGILFRLTHLSHFLHVLISVFSSTLYLFIFVSKINLFFIFVSIPSIFFSVTFPCCVSDFFLKKK
ncbi:MAG: hypothetical protein QW273_02860 [Candidatus Pacearchaeota archaeon]